MDWLTEQGPQDPEWDKVIVPLLDFVDSYVYGSAGERDPRESRL